jgi:chromosome segregation ATPase
MSVDKILERQARYRQAQEEIADLRDQLDGLRQEREDAARENEAAMAAYQRNMAEALRLQRKAQELRRKTGARRSHAHSWYLDAKRRVEAAEGKLADLEAIEPPSQEETEALKNELQALLS